MAIRYVCQENLQLYPPNLHDSLDININSTFTNYTTNTDWTYDPSQMKYDIPVDVQFKYCLDIKRDNTNAQEDTYDYDRITERCMDDIICIVKNWTYTASVGE
jgi:hypothetical protein